MTGGRFSFAARVLMMEARSRGCRTGMTGMLVVAISTSVDWATMEVNPGGRFAGRL